MNKCICITLTFITLCNFTSYSQMGIGTTSPNASSVLHLYSTNKGFLPPRMITTLRNSISTPAHGLLIFNFSNNAVEYYDSINATWKGLLTSYNSGWWINGNSNTNSYSNFIGTTDNRSLSFRTNNLHRMRIDSTGKVGIGTTLPNTSAALHVYSTNKGFLPPRMNTSLRNSISTPAHGLLIFNFSNGNMEFYDSVGASWKSLITSVTAGWYTVGNSGTNSYTNFIGTTDNRSLTFKTNNIERVRFDSTGKIGIGTSVPNSTLQLVGSLTLPVNTVTGSAYTPTVSDYTILCNFSGATTINLPAAATVTGRIYVIKKLSLTSSGNVIIDPNGTELIDGATTDASLNAQYESMIIQSDGTGWNILARQ